MAWRLAPSLVDQIRGSEGQHCPARSSSRVELDRWRREQGEVARETDPGLVTMQVGPSARRRRALIALVSLLVPMYLRPLGAACLTCPRDLHACAQWWYVSRISDHDRAIDDTMWLRSTPVACERLRRRRYSIR
jgi:hypothetical protein